MTVMIDRFFGLHQHVIRSGLWAKMKPGEKDLYIYLMEQSEYCCCREMKRTDAQITDRIGTAGRTLCNARKKLQEYGLIRCSRSDGNKYVYTICNPVTRLPYPGNPKQRLVVPKSARVNGRSDESATSETQTKSRVPNKADQQEVRGVPGVFDN